MGASCSADEEAMGDQALTDELKREKLEDKKIYKVLLLGPGSSGKSTIIKQMIKIYGTGFSPTHRSHYKQIIYNNIIDSMVDILNFIKVSNFKTSESNGLSEKGLEASHLFKNAIPDKATAFLTLLNVSKPPFNSVIKTLWNESLVKSAYNYGYQFHLNECCRYFFDKIDVISDPNYDPSDDDILQCRSATTGVSETNFSIKGNHFKMFDVGGQRSERRKWIHCFEGVNALIYIAALSEFDQMLIEDQNQNRLTEAVTLFKGVVNLKWFKDTTIILFLNKQDIFAEKLGLKFFANYFPEYSGSNSFDAVVEWIQNMFLKQNTDPSRRIYVHVTHATDTKSTEAVFNAVRSTIIKQVLKNMNLT